MQWPLHIVLLDLKGTPFERMEYVGIVPEGTDAGGPYTWVLRLFRPARHAVMLSEWDFALDDGGVLEFWEFLNTKVKDAPATISLSNTRANSAQLWELSWVSGTRQLNLYYSCERAPCVDRAAVLALAESLPVAPTSTPP